MKRFFSIGELTRLQNISRQTLIFYDKTGLFRPAYIDPDNGYRYYSSNQLDYLDTICIMKRIGFSLGEIKAHMKSYTIDDSIVALRKQLSIIDRQIKELQMIKKRVENRCLQMEHSVSIRDCSDIVSVEEVSSRYILLQEVAAPEHSKKRRLTSPLFAGFYERKRKGSYRHAQPDGRRNFWSAASGHLPRRAVSRYGQL